MSAKLATGISRRQFLAVTGVAAGAAWLAPRTLFAQTEDPLVPSAFKEAATAKVTVQALRRNISVLYGAGGNIAVLTGPDGDTFWNRNYPFIDYSIGGSIDGQIRAAEANLAKVTEKTIVIGGHGAVGGKADLVLFRDVLIEIREKVAALKKQGKSLEEVVAAKPSARTDEEWGQSFMNPSRFLALVYQGV